MTNPDLVLTVGGALLMGLTTSLHCAGMCGPLACLACQRKGCATDLSQRALTYHGSRLVAYTLLGALAGTLGQTLVQLIPARIPPWATWSIGAALVAIALFGTRTNRLFERIRSPKPWLIGAATPLLPCGPLYLVFAFCALSGSPIRGATLALAFGIGTVPLLWAAQHGWSRLQLRFGPRTVNRLQRFALIASAALIVWRLQAMEGGLCCHSPAG